MEYDGIKIIGSDRFVKQTIAALEFIKKKSKRDYAIILKYLRSIKLSKYSGMDLEKAQFRVGRPTAYGKYKEWYPSTIVHDVHHYYLHNIQKFPWIKKNFEKHEKLCVSKQISFLKQVHAPKKLISHCKNSLKTGYWQVKERNW